MPVVAFASGLATTNRCTKPLASSKMTSSHASCKRRQYFSLPDRTPGDEKSPGRRRHRIHPVVAYRVANSWRKLAGFPYAVTFIARIFATFGFTG
jgi:hypothetical protein